MPEAQAYLNIGLWCGFSFVSGIIGNPTKTCIGVDNFSDPCRTRPIFMEVFNHHRSDKSTYFADDYRAYFKKHHADQMLGVYFYDGDHAYEHQLLGLEIAEPFLAPNSYILVDDTNIPHVRQANLDFMAKREGQYSMVFDKPTPNNGHPTWWNGLMIFKRNV